MIMERNNMYSNVEELNCKHCGIDTLQDVGNSIVVIHETGNLVDQVFVCCKGECDDALGGLPGWKDLKDFTNPYLYLKHVMAVFNNIHEDGMEFTSESLEGYKSVLLKTAPYVFRDMSDKEIDSAAMSNAFPF
jgi:hypothetical protein